MNYDVAIVGAGITGTMIAYKLAKYNLNIVLLDKGNDVAVGTTKANSAIVHAGFDAKPNTMKCKMNVAGAKAMGGICEELHVPYKQNGSLVVAFSNDELPHLQELFERGKKNGVDGLKIVSKDELLKLEPNINPEATGALFATTGAIVCPYELCVATAENAVINGVVFRRNFEVKSLVAEGDIFSISSATETLRAKIVINAAGLYADRIAAMIGDNSFTITPRRGEYILLDKNASGLVRHTVFQCPTKMGKGVLITPTVDNNILVGPTAEDITDKSDVSTTISGLDAVVSKAKKSVPNLPTRDTITSFAGLRAHCDKDDFVISFSQANKNLINVAGIESPGLASSPAIADEIVQLLGGVVNLQLKRNYKTGRKNPVRFREMDNEQRKKIISQNSAYGQVICRCELVTEGEIIDAIKSPVGAVDLDGVKRRTRAGMGRCQSGFCGSKVMEILARELGVPIEDITKDGGNSNILIKAGA